MSAIAHAPEQHRASVEDYFELETHCEERHEYIDGEIVPMPGGTPNHNRIAGNLFIALSIALKGKPYEVFHADQRLWIPGRNLYTYPDVMVTADKLQFAEGRDDTLINPLLIAEVLSRSTQSYDRNKKFAAYRTIESFQEYLLIDQYTYSVELFSKCDRNRWIYTIYENPEEIISLESFPLQTTLKELYNRVELESVTSDEG